MGGPVSVRGGANGVEAHYDDMTAAARLFGSAAGSTGEAALRLHGYLVHPAVIASAVLDPGGAGEFEARLLAALDGPNGITWLTARCSAVDMGLRAAAAAYIAADRLDQRIVPEVDALVHAPAAIADAAAAFGRGAPGAALQRLLTDDPELADLAIGASADVFNWGSVSGGTRLLSRAFDDRLAAGDLARRRHGGRRSRAAAQPARRAGRARPTASRPARRDRCAAAGGHGRPPPRDRRRPGHEGLVTRAA